MNKIKVFCKFFHSSSKNLHKIKKYTIYHGNGKKGAKEQRLKDNEYLTFIWWQLTVSWKNANNDNAEVLTVYESNGVF